MLAKLVRLLPRHASLVDLRHPLGDVKPCTIVGDRLPALDDGAVVVDDDKAADLCIKKSLPSSILPK